ncbi:FAD-binding protein [Alcaligenes faecalis]|uniref:NAD(P)/FAD-dependent oxidoreductase n=1 Tax=Alcaligenes faecalis TaxID=511 RepID=UPI00137B9B92|nr:tryptophan 7-halogenase [Alcaligenes faecalis]QHS36773.1 FAD-binding protein [Alcaligenes faecalis]
MIIVVGAGVAGLAAARRLSMQGQEVTLVAPQEPQPSFGETLSERGAVVLTSLGWASCLDESVALRSQGRFSVWGGAGLRTVQDEDGQGYLLDKARLEQALFERVQKEEKVSIRQTRVLGLEHQPEGVIAKLADGTSLEAAALIDCTGRAALSAGAAAERHRLDRLVAAWHVFDLPEGAEPLAASLVEAVELGWWYLSPMPGHRLMVALFSDSDLLPDGLSRDGSVWAGLLGCADAARVRMESLGLDSQMADHTPKVSAAASCTVSYFVEGRILRAGDAGAAMDPLAANGLATALWSGSQSAQAALALTQGNPEPARAYEKDYLLGLVRHLNSQHALYGMEQRYAAQPFWQRRHRALE